MASQNQGPCPVCGGVVAYVTNPDGVLVLRSHDKPPAEMLRLQILKDTDQYLNPEDISMQCPGTGMRPEVERSLPMIIRRKKPPRP